VISVLKEGVILKPGTLILRNEKKGRFLGSHLLSDKEFLKKGARVFMSVLSVDDKVAAGEILPSTAFVQICCRSHPVSYPVGTGVWRDALSAGVKVTTHQHLLQRFTTSGTIYIYIYICVCVCVCVCVRACRVTQSV